MRNGEEWAVTTNNRLMFNSDEVVEVVEAERNPAGVDAVVEVHCGRSCIRCPSGVVGDTG